MSVCSVNGEMLNCPQPKHMPCPECGVSVRAAELDEHVCSPDRWLDYQVFQLREEIEAFEAELAAHLSTPRGRFELFYAERERRAA